MCGRYGFTSSDADFIARFDIENEIYDLNRGYNIGPTRDEPVVVRHSPNSAVVMHWGYTPEWMKKTGKFSRPIINARDDKLLTSKMYIKQLQFQRCIVPANFFYEWKGEKGNKTPILFKLKDEDLFGFAGLTFTEMMDDGKKRDCFVIITTSPNELMEPVHNRMPVILRKEMEDAWLNPDNTDPEKLLEMLQPYPADKMVAYKVSKAVNIARNDSGDLIKPIDSM